MTSNINSTFTGSVSDITVCSWNCNGALISKKTIIENFLNKNKIDILLINETKLINKDKFSIKNYAVLRADRNGTTRAGGVMALIHENTPYIKCNQLMIRNLETISFKVEKTIITAAYNPPNNQLSVADLDAIFNQGETVWLIGDLNSKHILWNNNTNNVNGNTLKNYIDNNALHIAFTDSPTHYPTNGTTPSTIDILVTKNTNYVINLQQYCCLDSDHNPVYAKMPDIKKQFNPLFVRSFHNTNWAEFRTTINNKLTMTKDLDTTVKLDNCLKNFTATLTDAINKHSKLVKIVKYHNKLPSHVLELIKSKNKARKKFQTTGSPNDKILYYDLINKVKNSIQQHNNDNWKQFLSNLSPKDNSLWRVSKKFTKKTNAIPNLINNNQNIVSNKDKCELFAKTFSKVHQLDPSLDKKFETEIINLYNSINAKKVFFSKKHLGKILTNPEELINKIAKLKNNKAPGDDGIVNLAIKNIPRKAICQLMYIINATIKLQYFPSVWKIATIIPIHKPGKDSTSPLSYRPISLLPSLAKIAERIIIERLNKHTDKAKILPKFQFGFRQKLGTDTQLVRIINDISVAFNQKKTTVMLLYDIEKAFDRVWQQALITKLYNYKYPLYLIKLLQSYLKDRQFSVRIGDTKCTLYPIEAGVPQGSVLGPSLFNIYISDIPTFNNTQIAQFADDTAIYATSFSAEVAYRKLTIHNHYLQKYFTKWKIKLNSSKTEIITFTKKKTDVTIHSLKSPAATLKPVKQVKYLGMVLDRGLTFSMHITKAIKAAYMAINRVYPIINRKSQLSLENKLLLYKAVIRPVLTYAAPAWCSASVTSIKRLQLIQNKCLRIINSANRYTKITELHKNSNNLPFLEDFIIKLSLAFYNNRLAVSELTKNLLKSYELCRRDDGRIIHRLPYSRISNDVLL